MNSKNNYKFISIFEFKNNESKQKFINFALSENGLKKTRNFKGCLSINIFSSSINPNKIIMLQKWNSKKSKKLYLEMRKKEGLNKFLEKLVSKPVKLDLINIIEPLSKL